ncbi:MAG: hypothetical protein J6P29_06100, partial [Acetobacter sp.]|nr:hypothetical protein [Acetobacter sp.]
MKKVRNETRYKKVKACVVALRLWSAGAIVSTSPPPVLAADASSNAAQEQEAQALLNKGVIILCELF